MKKVVVEISKCSDCPHSTNTSKEHDCAFTSEPAVCRWWCRMPNGPRNINPDKINEKCPLGE